MGVADEKIEKIRWRRQAENTLADYDYSVRLFFVGWALFLVVGVVGGITASFMMLTVLRKSFGMVEDLALVNAVIISMFFSVVGYLFGQLVAIIILRKLGKRWRGNLNFGKHPIFFISLASFITFNICFFLLLSLIFSFK